MIMLTLTAAREPHLPIVVSIDQIAVMVAEPQTDRANQPTGQSEETSIVLVGSGAIVAVTESIEEIFTKVQRANDLLMGNQN